MNERMAASNPVERDENAGENEYPRSNEPTNGDTGQTRMSTADIAYGPGRASSDGSPEPAISAGKEQVSLIQDGDAGGFRERWTEIQTKFIDEPRETVSEADELVAEVIQSLARRFAEERESLESQWQSGSEVSTEDLRLSMQRYRAFFERLLAA